MFVMKIVTICTRVINQGGWDVRGLVALVAETRRTTAP